MRIFYDTEFREDGVCLEILSIGMVREDGREYYAVNADADWTRVYEHPWLREHVLPHLPWVGTKAVDRDTCPQIDHSDVSVKPRSRIALDVCDFVVSTPEPSLWAWYASFDHVALAWLYGSISDLPKGMPMRTNDLKQEAERLGDPPLPEQDSDLHHALADARHNRVIFDFLRRLDTESPHLGDSCRRS
ncbi:3'-5' exoribonuclease domain-containing protein [Nocardiopsis flavescens]